MKCEVTGEEIQFLACFNYRKAKKTDCLRCSRVWEVSGIIRCNWCGAKFERNGNRRWCKCDGSQEAKYQHDMAHNAAWRLRNPEKVKESGAKFRAKNKKRPERTASHKGRDVTNNLKPCSKCGQPTPNYYGICSTCRTHNVEFIPTECMGWELPAGF